jgi:ATP-dependent Clp protease ATP-binding subunit ClpC
MNGYNFTERVRKVLAMAREEACRLHHEYTGTEHILLGLIREGEGVAATILQNLSVELDVIPERLERIMHRGASRTSGPDLPYTSRAKKVLELAMAEAREVGHAYVGTEHLLMGLLREEKGLAAQVLGSLGVTTDNARREMLRILGSDRDPDRRTFAEGPPHIPLPPELAVGTMLDRLSAFISPASDRPVPSAIVVEKRYPDGKTERRECGSTTDAMKFLLGF